MAKIKLKFSNDNGFSNSRYKISVAPYDYSKPEGPLYSNVKCNNSDEYEFIVDDTQHEIELFLHARRIVKESEWTPVKIKLNDIGSPVRVNISEVFTYIGKEIGSEDLSRLLEENDELELILEGKLASKIIIDGMHPIVKVE